MYAARKNSSIDFTYDNRKINNNLNNNNKITKMTD